MLRSLLNLIYPPECLVCRTRIEEGGLCRTCLNKIRRVSPAVNQIKYIKNAKNVVYYNRVYSVAVYEGVLKEIVHLFKYSGKLSLAGTLSQFLIEFAQESLDINRFDCIIPVPLNRARLREREFNQSTQLAKPLADRFGIDLLSNVLERNRATLPQSSFGKKTRLENIKGAFRVRNHKAIKEKNVLLVDDVYTTGATVNECAKVLRSSGAADISVLTLARGE